MKRAIIILAAIAAPAFGKNDFADQLARAERTYLRETTAALLPEYERYLTELASLERESVSEGNFGIAATIQAERLRIRNLIASSKSPPSAKRRVHTFKKENAASSGNTLSWTPKSPIAPGGYKVTLQPEAKGAIISEGFHTAKPGHPLRISTGKVITITLPPGTQFTQLTLTPGA